jgi:RNA polymerase sigma factor for flagellar operon FliA
VGPVANRRRVAHAPQDYSPDDDKHRVMPVLPQGKYSPEERDHLILEHLPQVKLIARRVHESIHHRVELDDLISVGTMGLIAAIDRFDPDRNLKLKTYAEHKIRGAILDHLRTLDNLSRDDRTRTKQSEAARAALEHRLQRTPTQTEVADEMGLSLREYSETLTKAGADAPVSLDAQINHADGALKFSDLLPDSAAQSPEQELVASELRSFVSNAVNSLEPKTKSIITLHYAHGLTMRAIAPLLAMSEWQVQQIRRKAIVDLRLRLAQVCVRASSVSI